MTDPRSILDHLENALANPDRVVLGLVDELVVASREHDLKFGWQGGCCYVTFPGLEPFDQIEAPLRKSAVRAALARIAVLCNDRGQGSVSPYGGQGEIVLDADPSRMIWATFVNTPETLSLELTSVSSEVASLVGPSSNKSAD